VPVEIKCDAARGRPYARGLRSDAQALLRMLELEDLELSLMVVGDAAMRSLNRHYRGKDQPTDVLSFAQLEQHQLAELLDDDGDRPAAPACGPILGDVVISADTALRQARDLRIAPAARLRALLIHGFLHLLGYDHERSPAEAKRMFARERELAAKLAAPNGARRSRTIRRPATSARSPRRTSR
jgi:rRNA maturation RNase YbeY